MVMSLERNASRLDTGRQSTSGYCAWIHAHLKIGSMYLKCVIWIQKK